MNILYVEDDRIDAEAVQRELYQNAPHCRVEIVATQKEALERLKNHVEDYELVLTDFQLPDGDGLTLLRHIRGQALPLAVVVITGQGDEETAITVLKAGANDYIVKRKEYLARLPLTLENALHRYRADIIRRAHPLRVLYAEHNTTDIDLTCRHLERYAPYVTIEAIYKASDVIPSITSANVTYDVLLLDYRLPGMNALELLKELQQRSTFDIPIVLVTGQGDTDVATQALKLGASDYITKNSGYLYQLPSVLENAYHRTQLAHEQMALRESEQRLRSIVEHMPVLLNAFDEQGRIIFWNTECERVTGYTANEIVDNPQAMELLVPDPEYRTEILKRRHVLGNYYRDWEFTVTCKNGQIRTIAWSNFSRDYPIPGWWSWGIGLDVTARKMAEDDLKNYSTQLEEMVRERTAELQKAQEQLVRQEKLAILGQLSGSVAHELRHPLGVLSNAAYFLKVSLPDANDTTHEYLEMMATEIRKADKIISDLLGFSRNQTADQSLRTCVRLSELIADVLAEQPPPDGIKMEGWIDEEGPPVMVNAQQIKQVLANLILNAYQAMPDGGTLTVGSGQSAVSSHPDGESSLPTAHCVLLTIQDSGCGIAPEYLEKVFEPLFTTKPKGIGLGLAIGKTLIEANGGMIRVDSEEGKGTSFTLALPVSRRKLS